MPNENDKIREKILKHLYDKYKNAFSIEAARESDGIVELVLRNQGHNNKDIVSNFIYLVQSGWIKKESENYSFDSKDYLTGKAKKEKGKQIYYIISDKGINHFEGPSVFQKSHIGSGINITNVQGITVIGNNNFVQQNFNELYRGLDLLLEEIRKSAEIKDEEKISIQSEIETIKSQLAKQNPNKNIIKEAWAALSCLSTVEGAVQFYERIVPLIQNLFK